MDAVRIGQHHRAHEARVLRLNGLAEIVENVKTCAAGDKLERVTLGLQETLDLLPLAGVCAWSTRNRHETPSVQRKPPRVPAWSEPAVRDDTHWPACARLSDHAGELRSRGCEVIEIDYDAVGKLRGLFRCSTLPLASAVRIGRDRSLVAHEPVGQVSAASHVLPKCSHRDAELPSGAEAPPR